MRILVLGAGGPAGVNTCRALNDCGYEVYATDENPDHLEWCKPWATVVPWQIGTVADMIIPQPDRLVMSLADQPPLDPIFLPDRRTIALCQDKFETGLAWRRAGLREDRIELIDAGMWIPTGDFPLWVRARHGAGAKAAINARTFEEASYWLGFWYQREPKTDFIAEEYLPGRDYAWSSIWHHGELAMSFTRERLEYLYPGLTPEGLTGTPTIARIVHDDRVYTMAEAAVYAVDQEPHGFFSVDLREDEHGIPRPTEINAGRVFTTFGLWAMQHQPNLFTYAFEPPDKPLIDCLPDGLTMYRHIDCPAVFKTMVPA